jgi:hypothetical protein
VDALGSKHEAAIATEIAWCAQNNDIETARNCREPIITPAVQGRHGNFLIRRVTADPPLRIQLNEIPSSMKNFLYCSKKHCKIAYFDRDEAILGSPCKSI